MIDSDNSGSISIDEFKKFSQSPEAEVFFRKIMNKLRKRQNLKGMGEFLPFNINRLLDHMSNKAKRVNLIEKIEENKFNLESTNENILAFVKLFILDEGSKESLIKESTQRLVESSRCDKLNKKNLSKFILSRQTFKAKMRDSSEKLKRIDSCYLNEMANQFLNPYTGIGLQRLRRSRDYKSKRMS